MKLHVECRFAPCSQSPRLSVRDACSTLDDKSRLLIRESFAPGAWEEGGCGARFNLGHGQAPVGSVVITTAGTGRWHIADIDIDLDDDDPLTPVVRERVKVGARVSPGFYNLLADRDEDLGIVRHRRARLDEISLLADDAVPGYLGAVITRVREVKPAPAGRGETSVRARGQLLRRDCGSIIALR